MGFDKKRWYEVFLCCVMPVLGICTVCYGFLLFLDVSGDDLYYFTYDPLPFMFMTDSAFFGTIIGFFVYFGCFVYAVGELLIIKKRVKTDG